ncbi:hypothetical protein [Burkholderia cepacia]|uniref:hypothetical protein n=1 Tax=Burkholderia cepacia TaxID=292 RepID=UPI001576B0AA|nr:hypothetical protein [Burkholderia cepacia]
MLETIRGALHEPEPTETSEGLAKHVEATALADQLSRGTIDRLMNMSDAELAAALLLGRINLSTR